MGRRKKYLCVLMVSSLALFVTYSRLGSAAYRIIFPNDWQIPQPIKKATTCYNRLRSELPGYNVINQTTNSGNTTDFRENTLQINLVKDNKNTNKKMKDSNHPRISAVKSKDTSDSGFTYNSQLLYSTIKKVREAAGYRHPWNETCEKRSPKCIIIGVEKAGTRELIDFMAMHPNIVIKRNPYEIGYFLKENYTANSSGTEWYRRQMPCSYSDQITVTKYPWYFASPLAAQRIYKFNKTIKLIALVREPVERLVSAHTFLRNLTILPPIETKVILKNGEIDRRNTHVNLSLYDSSIMNYLKYFTLDQILIIESNLFKNNPYVVLQRVESFLGLQHSITKASFVYNADKHFYCIKYRKKASCYDDRRGRVTQPDMSEAIRTKFKNFFRPHNERFFGIIGKRFNW